MGDHDSSPYNITRELCVQSIQAAAADVGEPLSMRDYDRWREDTIGWRPAAGTIKRIGGWLAICDEAGVEPRGPGAPSRSFDEFLDALIYVREALGEWPSQRQYIDEKRESDPSHSWMYDHNVDGVDSWQDAIEIAKSRE